MENLTQFKELGVAGIAIGALAFVTYKLIVELKESRINYQSFVQDNNHTTTDLVRQATATMVEVRNAIKTHNEISENQNETLKRLLEKVK